MFIGFIYDIVKIIQGQIGTVVYPIIYFIVCFAYVILSFFDNIFNKKYTYLILDKLKVVSESELKEEEEVKESEAEEIKADNKNDNGVHDSQKSKNEWTLFIIKYYNYKSNNFVYLKNDYHLIINI